MFCRGIFWRDGFQAKIGCQRSPPRPPRAGLPPYHEKLFPEISFRPHPPLFGAVGIARERTATPRQERTPGNTIRKVYLCRAQAKGLKPGDILMFYLSRDRRLAASQSLTTVGTVEQCRESRTADELVGDDGPAVSILGR